VAIETLRHLGRRTAAPIVVGGAHPSVLPERFLEAGARWVVRGEGEPGLDAIIEGSAGDGVVEAAPLADLDLLPDPDYGVLPLRSYWELGLGHGPVSGAHLTVSTSRGCSHGCRFCATPSLGLGRWRGMGAERVVEMVSSLVGRHQVTDIHVEDDDFAADRDRVLAICEGLKERGLRVRIALPSGVRSEPLDAQVLAALASAGCRYIALAPETGSPRLLRAMGKHIDLEHVVSVAATALRLGIRVGCFFVLGFPSETGAERAATADLVERLVRLGVDDVSVFVWSPLPGAAASDLERGSERLEQLCWSPRWRAMYFRYEGARVGIYLRALGTMLRERPSALLESARRIVEGRFETKGEMTVRRMLGWRG